MGELWDLLWTDGGLKVIMSTIIAAIVTHLGIAYRSNKKRNADIDERSADNARNIKALQEDKGELVEEVRSCFSDLKTEIKDQFEVVHKRIDGLKDDSKEEFQSVREKMDDMEALNREEHERVSSEITELKVNIAETNGDIRELSAKLSVAPCNSKKDSK